mgnify:CR=1 FL=1
MKAQKYPDCKICGKKIPNSRKYNAWTCSIKCHLKNIRINARRRELHRKMEVLLHYGGNPPKCACCGESHIEFLLIDHMTGDGNKHRHGKYRYSGSSFYIWLIKNNFPDSFQVLCSNCNFTKRNMNKKFCKVHHMELYK